MMRVVTGVLGALLSLTACGTVPGDDDLTAGARSPDGRLIARLWCADYCDVPGRTVLTIEPADRAVATTPGNTAQDHPRGDLSDADTAAILYARGDGPDRLAWTAPRTLVFALSCPSDGNMRAPGTGKVFRDVTILYRDSSNGAACR